MGTRGVHLSDEEYAALMDFDKASGIAGKRLKALRKGNGQARIIGLMILALVVSLAGFWFYSGATLPTSKPQVVYVNESGQVVTPPVQSVPVGIVVVPTSFTPTAPQMAATVEPTPTVVDIDVRVVKVTIGGVLQITAPGTFASLQKISIPPASSFQVFQPGVCGYDGLIFKVPPLTVEAYLVKYNTPSGFAQVQILPATAGNAGTVNVLPTCLIGDKYFFYARTAQ